MDSDFRGEVKEAKPESSNQKIAQLISAQTVDLPVVPTRSLAPSARGGGGF